MFRMFLDLSYCKLLLQYAAKMYQLSVLKGASPPRDVFYSERGYQELLQRTRSIAAASQVVAVIAADNGSGVGLADGEIAGMFGALDHEDGDGAGIDASRWGQAFV